MKIAKVTQHLSIVALMPMDASDVEEAGKAGFDAKLKGLEESLRASHEQDVAKGGGALTAFRLEVEIVDV